MLSISISRRYFWLNVWTRAPYTFRIAYSRTSEFRTYKWCSRRKSAHILRGKSDINLKDGKNRFVKWSNYSEICVVTCHWWKIPDFWRVLPTVVRGTRKILTFFWIESNIISNWIFSSQNIPHFAYNIYLDIFNLCEDQWSFTLIA